MNRKMPFDRVLIVALFALLTFGLVMVSSASSVVSQEVYGSSAGIFNRQLISTLLGLALMFIAMRIDYHHYQRRIIVWAVTALVGGALIWVLMGPEVNGVKRWIPLGPTRFQPSEAAKLALVLLTAWFLVGRGGRLEKFDRQSLPYLGVVGIFVVLVLAEPDFGTATSLLTTSALLLYIAGLNYRYYLGAALAAIPFFYFFVYLVPYRRERILAFWNPEADPYGSGYQILQSLVAVGSGGVAGKGLAQGTQKLFFLPEPHTDFIYAVVAEETGLLGCLGVLICFMVLLWRGIHIAMRSDTLFGTYLSLGIISMIVFQALFNISVVLSLCPTKGIPLPFISVGGSSTLVMLTLIGILLNISKHTRGLAVSAPSESDRKPDRRRDFGRLAPNEG